MNVRWIGFGEIEVEGERYTHDVVIDRGAVARRAKKPSKQFRGRWGHTPLSVDERIPWGGSRLVVGTGAWGSMPVMPEVRAEAERRGIELVAVPTQEAIRLLADVDVQDACGVLHVTC